MVKISLKSLLKNGETLALLRSVAGALNSNVGITDESGKILFGTTEIKEYSCPVKGNGEVIGFVYGAPKAQVITDLLHHLLQKESERKKLGAEVLNLYQEINLIFNFSEKLAQTIDALSISSVTLEEARHVVPSECGVLLLWDDKQKKLQVLSSYGTAFFEQETVNEQLTLLLKIILSGHSEIVTDTQPLKELGIVASAIKSVVYSALKVNHRIMGAIILGSTGNDEYTAAHLKLLTTLALQSSAAIESALLYEKNIREAKEREDAMRLVYEATGKFVPYEFIGALGHKVITDVKLGDQVEKIVTVLFSDIRDYTTLSEQMTPEENFEFVCSFNERMGPAIRQHHGFINQYLGDAIMAIFPEGAGDALLAAIEMQLQVDKLNRERLARHQRPIQMGIGMHTGPLIMGITGDEQRMDATTISDTVNTASRLESLTKHYRASILLSDTCLLHIDQQKFDLRYLGPVQLKGKHEPTPIYECFSAHPPEAISSRQMTLPLFNKGMEHYLNSSFAASADAFQTVTDRDPGDLTAAFFLENARKYLQKGIPRNWNGVMEMVSK